MAGNLNDLHAFRFDLDGSAAFFDFVCTRGWRVVDIVAATDTTIGGATASVRRSAAATPAVFNDVTPIALPMATADRISYADEITPGQSNFSAGDTLRVVTVNAADGVLLVEVLPTTWVPG